MEWLLIISSALLMIGGIVGALLPIIPGPSLCYAGLVLLHLTDRIQFSTAFLVLAAIIVLVVSLIDFIVPAWGTKKLGGSKAGVRGSLIGLIIGVFIFPLYGIIFGPVLGAITAELLIHPNSFGKAIRSGFGSFMGFLMGTGLKLATGLWIGTHYAGAFF